VRVAVVVFAAGFVGLPLQAQERPAEKQILTTNGDSLSTISLREFGSVAFGRLIAEYNGLNFDAELSAGKTLKIPLSAILDVEGAVVVFSKGEAQVVVRGERSLKINVKIGEKIFARDVIKTSGDGFVSLSFPSGTVVNIQPNSLVELRELDCLEDSAECLISLDAQGGALSSNVRQRKKQPTRFRVKTPHASAAVRGTIFDIDANEEAMLLGVTEGEVDIMAQGKGAGVTQGLGVRTLAGQPPDPPIKLLAAPDFRRAPQRITEQDSVSWYRVEGADHYRLSIARDADGAQAIYRQVNILCCLEQ